MGSNSKWVTHLDLSNQSAHPKRKKKDTCGQRIPLFPQLSHFLSRLREVEKITVKKVVATAPKAFYQTYAYMK